MAPEKLAAIRAACQWVLYGPECLPPEAMALLRGVDQGPGPGPHFGVADMLARLPPCWLHVGTCKQVPRHACYKAAYRGTWVWVTAQGLEGLSDFILVLHDIARADLEQPALYSLPNYRFLTTTLPRDGGGDVKVTVTIDDKGNLLDGAGKAPTFVPRRRDGEGADVFLRSLITSTSVR